MGTIVVKLTRYVLIWIGLVVLVATIHLWYERYRLEKEFGLRRGILTQFRTDEIDLVREEGELESYPFRVYTPNFRDSQAKYPVVLCLHGSGQRGSDNARQIGSAPTLLTTASFQESNPCFVISPQCPSEMNWTWFRESEIAEFSLARDPIIAIIERVLEDPRADRSRVYLIGYSMGSFGAWELAAEFPDVFAAVTPIAGGGSSELAESLIDVPIWTVHGSEDKACPVAATREIVERIKAAGGNIRYSELEGVGHGSWKPALQAPSEVLDWMFRQKRNTELSM